MLHQTNIAKGQSQNRLSQNNPSTVLAVTCFSSPRSKLCFTSSSSAFDAMVALTRFDLLHPYCPSRTLRSLGTSLLTVPRFSLETFGKRSFSVFGPTVWNSLPLSLRKTQCFTTFQTKLKTHLFHIHLY